MVNVCITGAAGMIAHSLIPLLLSSELLAGKKVNLSLLDITPCLSKLQGLILQLQDCAYTNLNEMSVSDNPKQAFKGADLIVFLGGFPRKPGMERKELLACNKKIFEQQGKAICQLGLTDTKCLIVANPANTNALILMHYATSLKKQNITCLTRLDQNRAVFQLAHFLKASPQDISKVVIWGNHSVTQVPDLHFAEVNGQVVKFPKQQLSAFQSKIQKRGAQILNVKGTSSVFSAAKAIVDHLESWENSRGKWVSMGVYSRGQYGGQGLIVSVPVVCKDFKWRAVQGLILDEDTKKKLEASIQQLKQQAADAQIK